MSKIEYYRCDYCSTCLDRNSVLGIVYMPELDFGANEYKKEYKTIGEPKAAFAHYCVNCYNHIVGNGIMTKEDFFKKVIENAKNNR